jgi:OOP family OmpA-OmpF porin
MKARQKRLITIGATTLLAFLLVGFSEEPATATSLDLSYYVLFDRGRAWPNEAGMKVIAQVIHDARQTASRQQGVHISLTGHTDRSGSEAYNMQLSQRRAESVRDILRKAGLTEDMGYTVYIVGRGESEPASPSEERQNRRVQVIIQ